MKKRKRILILSVVIVLASLVLAAIALEAYAESNQFKGKKILATVEFPDRVAGDQFGTTKVIFKDGSSKVLPGIHPLLKNYEGEAIEGVEAIFENGAWGSLIIVDSK